LIVSRLRRFVGRYRGLSRDARVFLASSFLTSAAFGLYFINFNLYLAALGFDPSLIGLVATTTGLTLAAAAVPASMFANRIGRRLTMLVGAPLSPDTCSSRQPRRSSCSRWSTAWASSSCWCHQARS
jgi:MFS family permease